VRFTEQEFAALVAGRQVKRNKYGAKPEVREGVRHDSKGEADWADGLRDRERRGEIFGLVLDKERLRYPLVVNGVLIAVYTADGRWTDDKGALHVADFKSEPTRKRRDYQLVRKLMLACHGIRIEEHSR
jgi:hypothetical protein